MINFDWLIGTFTIAYFLGSIPFGLLLTKLAGLGDIRSIGSGNIGATNVMRTGNKLLGITTLLLDAAKGVFAIMITQYLYGPDYALLAAIFVVIGHVFPVWLHFKGGKGVATTIGVFIGLSWILGAAVCGLWLIAFVWMRISSLASLLSIGYSSILAYVIVGDISALICLTLAMLILFTHRSNIERLMTGTEYMFKEQSS
jgi:acyl phosphate:glycerol-3-phosphate acyltransferase